MGNNNLDNNQPTGEQANVQAQAQPAPATNEQPTGQEQGGNEGQPSYADLMKQLAEAKVDNKRLKKANDSLSAENAENKRKLNEKMTVDEQKVAQQVEQVAELNDRLQKAEQELALNAEIKRNLALGMDEDSATKVAQLTMEGDRDSVNTLLKTFIEAEKKDAVDKAIAELYAKMPTPMSGNGDGQIDYATQYNEKLAKGDIQGAIEAQISGMLQSAK